MSDIEKLRARVVALEGQHKGLVLQNAILRQRPDLPLNRIPAARAMVKLYEENEKLRAALEAADALIQRMDEEADGFSRAVVVLDTEYRAARYLATGTAIPLTQHGGER